MPRVPYVPREPKSPLLNEKVSPTNVLMAAAEMNRLGLLTEQEDRAKPTARTGTKIKAVRQRSA